MSRITKIEPLRDHLRITVEGTYSLDDSLRILDQVLEAAVQHRMTRVLVDHRQEEGSPTTLERYETMTQAQKKYMELLVHQKIPFVRFAALGNVPRIDPNGFGETVATNRGLPLRVFADEAKALDWLLADEKKD